MQNNMRKDSKKVQGNNGNRYGVLNNIVGEDDTDIRILDENRKERGEMNGNKEDVYESGSGIAQTMAANIVNGMSKNVLN